MPKGRIRWLLLLDIYDWCPSIVHLWANVKRYAISLTQKWTFVGLKLYVTYAVWCVFFSNPIDSILPIKVFLSHCAKWHQNVRISFSTTFRFALKINLKAFRALKILIANKTYWILLQITSAYIQPIFYSQSNYVVYRKGVKLHIFRVRVFV